MRPVRFNLNPKEAEIADAISMGKAPDGVPGDGFFRNTIKFGRRIGSKKFFMAIAICHFLLWDRIYGNYGIPL